METKPQVKKHLVGGSLRRVQVDEIKRVMASHAGEAQFIERVALELGVVPRTLRVWVGPVEKGGWPELQVHDAMSRVLATKPKLIKRQPLKTKKRLSKTA